VTRPLWDMLLSELVGGSDDPDAGRLANEIERDVNARLRVMEEALKDVCNPLAALRRDAEAKGAKLSGMAYEIANSLSYVQGIARAALERTSVTPVSIEQSK